MDMASALISVAVGGALVSGLEIAAGTILWASTAHTTA